MILIGFMGAGKTSVAQTLSKSLNIPCYDLDKEIIKKIQIPLSDYFDKYGEMDVLRIFDNNSLGSYYKFLVKYEKEYTVRLSEDEEKEYWRNRER